MKVDFNNRLSQRRKFTASNPIHFYCTLVLNNNKKKIVEYIILCFSLFFSHMFYKVSKIKKLLGY